MGSSDVVKAVGYAEPVRLTLANEDDELFPWDDDGLEMDRIALIRYRVAAAIAETLVITNPHYERLSYIFMNRARERERDMHATRENAMVSEKDLGEDAMKFEDLDV